MEFSDIMITTGRLCLAGWNAAVADGSLPPIVAGIMTGPVTRALPEAWHGAFDEERAAEWIERTDSEASVLLATERDGGAAIGLLILYEDAADRVVRVGYVLREESWGKGIATEILSAFVEWAAGSLHGYVLEAGVGPGNIASERVLEKSGFERVSIVGDNVEYRLAL